MPLLQVFHGKCPTGFMEVASENAFMDQDVMDVLQGVSRNPCAAISDYFTCNSKSEACVWGTQDPASGIITQKTDKDRDIWDSFGPVRSGVRDGQAGDGRFAPGVHWRPSPALSPRDWCSQMPMEKSSWFKNEGMLQVLGPPV